MTIEFVSSIHSNTGYRRYTFPMLEARHRLEEQYLIFLRDREADPDLRFPTKWEALHSLEAYFEHRSYTPRFCRFMDVLVRETRACDWEEGSLPISAPSTRHLVRKVGVEITQIKKLTRFAAEEGLITFRDSPTGKRYIKRDRHGRIEDGFGFDLSPLRIRYREFLAIAKEQKKLRKEAEACRRHIFFLRKDSQMMISILDDFGICKEEDKILSFRINKIARIKKSELDPEILRPIEVELASIHAFLKRRISVFLTKSDPQGVSGVTPNTPTKPSINIYNVEKKLPFLKNLILHQ